MFASILVFGILLCLALVFVFEPIASRRSRGRATRERDRDRLLREKRSWLQLIRDLDFDYRTGKLSEEDHRQSREEAEARAIEILEQLDHLDSKPGWTEERLEAEIERVRSELERTSGASV